MKAVWAGYLTIGELAIPSRLYAATRSVRQRFVHVHAADGSPIDRLMRCEAEGTTIPSSEVARAVEVRPGEFVQVSDDELQRADAGRVKCLDVRQFTSPAEVDPVLYDKPYYLAPAKGGERAYALVREALVKADTAAVVEYMLHRKDHLGLVRPRDGVLMLYQLRFADEVVPRSDIKTPPIPRPDPVETEAALEALKRLSGPFYPEDYHDQEAERVKRIVERKAKGLPPPRSPRKPPLATPEEQILPFLKQAGLDPGVLRRGSDLKAPPQRALGDGEVDSGDIAD